MMQKFQSSSYLFGGNAPFIEEQYESYLENPTSVSEEWRKYFDTLQAQPSVLGTSDPDIAHLPIVQAFVERGKLNPLTNRKASTDLSVAAKQVRVQSLIAAYRFLGNRYANLDPLQRQEREHIPELDPSFYGFKDTDMELTFSAANVYFGRETMTLRAIYQALRETYCSTIGAEFMHLSDPAQKRWWQEKLESSRARPDFSPQKKTYILGRLTTAEVLERYLAARYVGQKRFSLEGGESFIPSLDEVIKHAGSYGIQEVIIGMAHRARLNVLVNILGKQPKDLFAEFEGKAPISYPAGDVKYHQGFSGDVSTPGGPVHVSLSFNPSHLEIVNPVVEGSVRARQDRRGDNKGTQVLPVLVHGDASFAGQGVVMETLNLSQTRGFYTGGTIHIVINNQIGFTTSDPRDARSTVYCSDVVKMIEAPVLHVNGDDPEAVVFASELAVEYRMKFLRDVVIDIVCFRKLGHNEQDTPAVTQPMMYRRIEKHPGTRQLYAEKLNQQEIIDDKYGENLVNEYRDAFDHGNHTVDPVLSNYKSKYAVDWLPYLGKKWTDECHTSLPKSEIERLSERLTTIPEGFNIHPLVRKVINDRVMMGKGELPFDWGMGELLAYASLVVNGYTIRITGQDVGRGTFTHRHAVLHDQERQKWDEGYYIPLQHIAPDQASFSIYDSVLSEEAVLGFEFGYSSASPHTLVVWEAQFGDFANGAQVVIDQFITSGDVKWGRVSGLTMFLPHGYEGQGPEHSSARIERFLQLCADTNIQVCQPTTPAQIFHLLRRQMIRLFRKPLIVFTPKSLLRHKAAVSHLDDFSNSGFQTIIDDASISKPSAVKRIVLCSGKVYYDLIAERDKIKKSKNQVAIVRLEQLYPFPHEAFDEIFKRYKDVKEIVWCQDEPKNQGPWFYMEHYIYERMHKGHILAFAGRPSSASPAVGYYSLHVERQQELLSKAFAKIEEIALKK